MARQQQRRVAEFGRGRNVAASLGVGHQRSSLLCAEVSGVFSRNCQRVMTPTTLSLSFKMDSRGKYQLDLCGSPTAAFFCARVEQHEISSQLSGIVLENNPFYPSRDPHSERRCAASGSRHVQEDIRQSHRVASHPQETRGDYLEAMAQEDQRTAYARGWGNEAGGTAVHLGRLESGVDKLDFWTFESWRQIT